MSVPNLVNLEKVSHSYGIRILLDEVSLGIVHDGQQKTVSVTLGDRPDSAGG